VWEETISHADEDDYHGTETNCLVVEPVWHCTVSLVCLMQKGLRRHTACLNATWQTETLSL